MARGARAQGRGFLAGLVLGLVLAACVALALAFLFPPERFFPPRIDPGAAEPPTAPAAPVGLRPTEDARSGSLLPPPALEPLVPNMPNAPMPAELPDPAPPSAPDVFDGGEAGSPSLFPR